MERHARLVWQVRVRQVCLEPAPDTSRPDGDAMFANRRTAALSAAGALALAGCGAAPVSRERAPAIDRAAAVTAGRQAASLMGRRPPSSAVGARWWRGTNLPIRGRLTPRNGASTRARDMRARGSGVRTLAVGGSVVTVSGDSAGTTGGMSARFAQQRYGRWEARMRRPAGSEIPSGPDPVAEQQHVPQLCRN